MAETSQHQRAGHDSKEIHHGRTTAAWTGSLIATVAFVLGGIALIMQNWPLFWVAVALLVIALIATRVLQLTGRGAT